jgi:predicted RNA-binding protein with PIN domain
VYLVDGHNLIGQLQDLSLDDPQDEAKLSMAVRRYCMRHRVKATIIFDNGVPGGVSRELSSSDVTVIFAPPGQQADGLLMRRARDVGKGKGQYGDMILVTSDRRILDLCWAYGIETMASEEFALLLGFRPVEKEVEPVQPGQPAEKRVYITFEKDPDPFVSPTEIAYWLTIFKRRQYEVRLARRQASVKQNGQPPDKSVPS